ncbi:hexose kinase [Melghirimyces algeriensis]|uniref:hexose kinase n=1 Tax=Melghirimyces algeriensis TaxID=910412 RepID=UPI001FEBA17B
MKKLILTITSNPSVDIGYRLDSFQLDAGNRVDDVSKTAGGKGLNVTRVLRQLEEEVAATGFLGGSLGMFIRKEISQLGVHDHFITISGDTRNCIAIIHGDGRQTEILESGPVISEEEAASFLRQFSEDAQSEDVNLITISGSLPKGLPADFYTRLIQIATQHQKPVLLDTKGDLLALALASNHKPYLIKPNQEELTAMSGQKDIDPVEALQSPNFAGIPWIVATMGSDGAVVKHREALYRVTIPEAETKNPVGSGDSVIAGFAAGLSRGLSEEELIQFALSMGVLNAIEEQTGAVDLKKIDWCMSEMGIERL